VKRAVVLVLCTGCLGSDEAPSGGVLVGATPGEGAHLGLGVPNRDKADDFLLVHPQFAAGYNRYLNASSWVSWRTTQDDYGPVDRFDGSFYADTSLPSGFFRTTHNDLTGSGYDRGHMLRSEERTRTTEDNYATFVMTNVLPQRPDLNRGPWFDFELFVQETVESTETPRDAYVVAGAVWPSECSTSAVRRTGDGCVDLGRGTDPTMRIAVPEATWKIVVFVDAGRDIADAGDAYIVGVVIPNESGISRDDWEDYRATVSEIENASGYDVPAVE